MKSYARLMHNADTEVKRGNVESLEEMGWLFQALLFLVYGSLRGEW